MFNDGDRRSPNGLKDWCGTLHAALFGRWPRLSSRGLRNDLKELRLDTQPTLMGLHYFLSGVKGHSVPATLSPQLVSLSDALDPALANPDAEIEISGRKIITLRDLDTRFSHSVAEGFQFIAITSEAGMMLGKAQEITKALGLGAGKTVAKY